MPLELKDKRITVMGLGRFGGGLGLAHWLVEQDAQVTVTDLQSAEQLSDSLEQIADIQAMLTLRLGVHQKSDFTDADLVVANPAVPHPWDNAYLNAATDAGVPISTEIRLLTERLNRQRVIGVTGSAGKSTTAAMIHHILHAAGHHAHLGGNIGGSLLGSLETIEPDAWVVLELSSFMLYWLDQGIGYADAAGWSPHIAVLTNLQPNHLDWHGTIEHYEQSKQTIFRWQCEQDHAITEKDAPTVSCTLKVRGQHNLQNASLAALAVHHAIGMSHERALSLLSDFSGLPHRLCLVAEHDGMRFVDDSKSTTPAATVLAVKAFDDPARVHLIAGGYDKGGDLSQIAELASTLGGMYTIGETGKVLANRAGRSNALYCGTLDVAVARAMNAMHRGDVLLLSPGCASWDQFTNYEQRGHCFAEAIARECQASADECSG
jgi:UDP-N-acetylmuramoylalanine--D-glutamate ligase